MKLMPAFNSISLFLNERIDRTFFPLGLNIAAKAYTEALLRLGQTARTTCSGGTEEIGKSFVLALCIGLVSDFLEVCSNLKTDMENAHLILNCFTKIILWHLSTFFWHLLIFFSLHIYINFQNWILFNLCHTIQLETLNTWMRWVFKWC